MAELGKMMILFQWTRQTLLQERLRDTPRTRTGRARVAPSTEHPGKGELAEPSENEHEGKVNQLLDMWD